MEGMILLIGAVNTFLTLNPLKCSRNPTLLSRFSVQHPEGCIISGEGFLNLILGSLGQPRFPFQKPLQADRRQPIPRFVPVAMLKDSPLIFISQPLIDRSPFDIGR